MYMYLVYRWVFGCPPVVGQPRLRGRGRREGGGSGRALGGRRRCHHLWNGLLGKKLAIYMLLVTVVTYMYNVPVRRRMV